MINAFVANFGQLPEVQRLYPKSFKVTSEEFVANSLVNDLRRDWATKIETFLLTPMGGKSAKSFLNQWANLAWNSLERSKNTLTKTKIQAVVVALPRTFFPAWESNISEIRNRWNARYPAYQALIRHLDSAIDPIDRATQLEVARQALGFGRLAQDTIGFLEQTYNTMWAIAYGTKNVDLDAGLEGIRGAATAVAAEATKILVKVTEQVVNPVFGTILANLPWWVWVGGLGALSIIVLPNLVSAFRR